MLLRPAVAADLPQIVALERLPESQRYVGQWTDEHHARALAGGNARYYVHEDDGEVQAYVLLLGFEEGHSSIEFKRFVVGQPGRGP